jgi:hypothetical protein
MVEELMPNGPFAKMIDARLKGSIPLEFPSNGVLEIHLQYCRDIFSSSLPKPCFANSER